MSVLHVPRVLAFARRFLLCRVDGVADRYALTFDDGPSARHTPALLALLAGHGARATFFVLGRNVRRRPDVLRQVTAAGHEVAVHGDGHGFPLLLTPAALVRDAERAVAAIVAAGAPRPALYRPPFGVMTPTQAERMRRHGLVPVLGDVYPHDPGRPGAERIAERVLARLRGGSIVILHDGTVFGDGDRGQTLAAVELVLAGGAARGLSAVTVSELRCGPAGSEGPAT